METPCSKAVHLPLFLIFLFSCFPSAAQLKYIAPWRLSISHHWCSSDPTHFAFITKFIHTHTHTHCSPRPLNANTHLSHAEMFTSWRQKTSLTAVSKITAYIPVLSQHCLHTIDSAQRTCTPLWRFFLFLLSAKPVLLAWDDQWFTQYLWLLDLQTFFFHTHMHSFPNEPTHSVVQM